MEKAESPQLNPTRLYQRLLDHYGPQYWWPADDPYEVILGAILTQNTAWTNVEKVLSQLREQRLISLEAMLSIPAQKLANLIRPAGFYQRKSACIKTMTNWLVQQGGIGQIRQKNCAGIRKELLDIPGIGQETADAILLYALDKSCFVVDSYTQRILSRTGLLDSRSSYSQVQQFLVSNIEKNLDLYQEYHALLVMHAKTFCRKNPVCDNCPIGDVCGNFQKK